MPLNAQPVSPADTATALDGTLAGLLVWGAAEARKTGKDEAQIVDTFITQIAEGVQAGKSWTDSVNEAKANFVAAELNEWQTIQVDVITKIASAVDNLKNVAVGFLSLG